MTHSQWGPVVKLTREWIFLQGIVQCTFHTTIRAGEGRELFVLLTHIDNVGIRTYPIIIYDNANHNQFQWLENVVN